MLSDQPAAADDFWQLDWDKQHSQQDGCQEDEAKRVIFLQRRVRTWKLLAHKAFSKSVVMKVVVVVSPNDGGAVAGAKNIFIVMSEKSQLLGGWNSD